MKKIKILVIGTFFSNVGGAEVIAYNTYKLLQKENYEVYFWACDKAPFWENDYSYSKDFTHYNKLFYWNYIY